MWHSRPGLRGRRSPGRLCPGEAIFNLAVAKVSEFVREFSTR